MLDENKVKQLLNSAFIANKVHLEDHPELPAALPDVSLKFLTELCSILGIQNIFEFGSGRSTKAFLDKGCIVASLEDSDYWMNQTLANLNESDKYRHTSVVKPLTTFFLGSFPVQDWFIDNDLKQTIKKAELILVDSPYYTPFRESTLWQSINLAKNALIIIDDTRIPTLQRFCDRLSRANSSLLHVRVKVGHGFDIFYNNSNKRLRLNHSITDFMKGWYRYFQGRRFYSNLKKVKTQ